MIAEAAANFLHAVDGRFLPALDADPPAAELEAGSFKTVRGRLAAGVSTEGYGFGAWVSRFRTDGISAADEADGVHCR